MTKDTANRYILGLDIGSNSIGWALLRSEIKDKKKLQPISVERTGVRVFTDELNTGFESGLNKPPAVARRQARLQRRQAERRARRLTKLFRLLQKAGLLPQGEADSPTARHNFILNLDRSLRETHFSGKAEGKEEARPVLHLLPYLLRARALDERLTPYELGRAVYHLAQRRGFKSNRRAAPKPDEKKGVVAQDISQLRQDMEAAGARTLGEYFANLEPDKKRIRGRWTARGMYEDEFEMIWTAQETHHPQILTPELKEQIFEAIFFQRPLKSVKHLIGKCDLEPNRTRAPWALPPAPAGQPH